MAGFNKSINLDPTMINGMDLAQKRECMSEIERRRGAAWKFSCIFCIALMAYVFIYALLSMMYSLAVYKQVKQMSILLYIIPVITMVPSFFAHSMNGKWVLAAVLSYMLSAFGVIVTGEWVNVVAAPFLFAGAFMYYRLSVCCDMYEALSKQEGFPEFFTLEHGVAMAKEIIERNSKKEEDELSPLTKLAIDMHKAAEEKPSAEGKSSAEENEKKEDPAEDIRRE